MVTTVKGDHLIPESSKNWEILPGTTIARLVPGGDDPFRAWAHYHHICSQSETVEKVIVFTQPVSGMPFGYWVGRMRDDHNADIDGLFKDPQHPNNTVFFAPFHKVNGVFRITVSTGLEPRAVYIKWHGNKEGHGQPPEMDMLKPEHPSMPEVLREAVLALDLSEVFAVEVIQLEIYTKSL